MQDELDIQPSSNAASWLTIAVLALCMVVIEFITPVPIALRGSIPLVIAFTTLSAVAYYYRTVRRCEEFAEMCVSLSQVLLYSAIGIILSYLVARANNPLWDSTLQRWDVALGFDWMAAMRLVDKSPLAVGIINVAYHSLIPQVIVVVCALGFQRRIFELRAVMLAAMLCGSVCIVISAFMPAVAYGVHLGIRPGDFQNVFPSAGFIKMPDFETLRSGTIHELDIVKMQGLITFPSYHSGLSVVTFWGFWAARQNWLRILGMTLAALTVVSTPIIGGHYLVDVIAGGVIAVACIAIARRAICLNPSFSLLKSSPSRHSHAAFGR
ncbi:MAG: phosphatase PAP2 family protein [Sphingomicrobium sp.]